MLRKPVLIALFVLSGNFAEAGAQPLRDDARGELLYSTHCIACHSNEVHWRDKKSAADLSGIQTDVRRWQKFMGLGWTDDDITAVTRYLNALHYHYPVPD